MNEDSFNEYSILGGPFVYSNWFLANKGASIVCIYEYPLLTDARITGEIKEGYGPYKFLNPVPIQEKPGLVRPSLFLRAEIHLKRDMPGFENIISDHGLLQEELAALASLAMGTRLKAGGVTRIFEPNSDPLGKPIGWDVSLIQI